MDKYIILKKRVSDPDTFSFESNDGRSSRTEIFGGGVSSHWEAAASVTASWGKGLSSQWISVSEEDWEGLAAFGLGSFRALGGVTTIAVPVEDEDGIVIQTPGHWLPTGGYQGHQGPPLPAWATSLLKEWPR